MSRTTRTAFTLMEMLVVVAIIVALAGAGVFAYIQIQRSSTGRIASAKAKALAQACKLYASDHNTMYPDSLEQLLQRDANGNGPYVDKAADLLDPWGQPYQYLKMGTQNGSATPQPDVWTTDPDGVARGNW
jgi:general secretion pathway protein G